MDVLEYIGLACLLVIIFCLGAYTMAPSDEETKHLTRKQKAEYKRFQRLFEKSKKHYYKAIKFLNEATIERDAFIDKYGANTTAIDESHDEQDK